MIMHDMRSPLFSQALLIDHLQRNYHKFSANELNDLFFLLKDSSDRICQFSTDFLIWYDSQRNGFSLRHEDLNLADFIDETTLLYRDIALRKGLYFIQEIPSGLGLVSDRNILRHRHPQPRRQCRQIHRLRRRRHQCEQGRRTYSDHRAGYRSGNVSRKDCGDNICQ
ncbi:hypothetical protein ACQ86N_19005 [Puia sp. P3]|uniref:hypothetical protein n=1 Tax=Puia sp. P3 TaxID=3423952 RepID=UPI003D667D9E